MSDLGNGSARPQILVVEDSKVFREMQEMLLGQAGYAVSAFENPQAALTAANSQRYDLVVIDYELPEMNGQQFMHALRAIHPEIAVIFVSGSLTLELAIQLSSQGVAGIFNKPANPKTLLEKINETLSRSAARDTAVRIGSSSGLPGGRPAPGGFVPEPTSEQLAYRPRFVVGSSNRFRELTHRLWKVRDFRSVLLLQGEPGSPFELLAREVAEISVFRDGPVMICRGQKFESRGLIEALAPSLLSHDAGTLIVTGVESFTPEQQKTLENLVTGRDVFLPFARRFRLVLAATLDLTDRVDEGTFNDTLYYKISSLSLTVPNLREMRGDIVLNAKRILAANHETGQIPVPLEIAPAAAEWIEAQEWTGNYDQLASAVVHAAKFAEGNDITLASFAAGWPEGWQASVAVATAPVVSIEDESGPTGETRPPFPVASAIADEAQNIPSPPSAIAGDLKPSPRPLETAATTLARAPASQLFAKPTPPPRRLTAQSLFRPASTNYSFTKRLAESLAVADSCAAH